MNRSVVLKKVQMFLQKGTPTPSSDAGAVYFIVGDADQLYEFHRVNGVDIAQAQRDVSPSLSQRYRAPPPYPARRAGHKGNLPSQWKIRHWCSYSCDTSG